MSTEDKLALAMHTLEQIETLGPGPAYDTARSVLSLIDDKRQKTQTVAEAEHGSSQSAKYGFYGEKQA